ncbi:PadR family transcriptional regulator [Archangium gephyra]|uniref:PadR family transcriptional regulator n=1 Tax=Archangium gephyra TaxID=48 RepID=UPI0035D48F11
MPPSPGTTSDAPLGTFEEQVLLAVVRTGRASGGSGAYGMAVRRELEEVTGREVAIGAVYATLDRLEVKGLVASERGEASAGASRRMFAVTPRGARALADSREMRERLWSGVDLVALLASGKARGA